VNGVPINGLTVQYYYEQQIKQMGESFKEKGGVPDAFQQYIRQNIINSLINEELLAQLAASFSIEVSEEELIAQIVSIWPAGEFDEVQYKTGHLPYFQQERGLDFEQEVKKDLQRRKLREQITSQIVITEEDILSEFQRSKTNFSVDFVKTSEELEEPCEVAKVVSEKWKSGSGLAAYLKEKTLKKESVLKSPFSELRTQLAPSSSNAEFSKVLSLSKNKPFLDEPLSLAGNSCLVVRYLSKSTPSIKSLEKEKEAIRAKLKDERIVDTITLLLKKFREGSEIVQKS
jgi:hypothetical protein